MKMQDKFIEDQIIDKERCKERQRLDEETKKVKQDLIKSIEDAEKVICLYVGDDGLGLGRIGFEGSIKEQAEMMGMLEMAKEQMMSEVREVIAMQEMNRLSRKIVQELYLKEIKKQTPS